MPSYHLPPPQIAHPPAKFMGLDMGQQGLDLSSYADFIPRVPHPSTLSLPEQMTIGKFTANYTLRLTGMTKSCLKRLNYKRFHMTVQLIMYF